MSKDIETFALIIEQRIKDIFRSHSRNWWIAAGVAVVFFLVLFFTLFNKNHENEALTILKQQQVLLDSLANQQKRIAEQDRLRDSVYWTNYVQNSARRESDLSNQKKKTNEIINHINQPDFNADSIRLWWASH
jgi:hypothetical protein